MSCHVLFVDDEDDVRRSVSRVLTHKGYTVTSCARGEDALEKMRANDGFDVILLDLRMPQMSGREVRERQLDEGLLPETPVIVLSGAETENDEEPEVDAAEHLVKPIRPPALYAALERYCGERSAPEADR